jgi:hypothetical protein
MKDGQDAKTKASQEVTASSIQQKLEAKADTAIS